MRVSKQFLLTEISDALALAVGRARQRQYSGILPALMKQGPEIISDKQQGIENRYNRSMDLLSQRDARTGSNLTQRGADSYNAVTRPGLMSQGLQGLQRVGQTVSQGLGQLGQSVRTGMLNLGNKLYEDPKQKKPVKRKTPPDQKMGEDADDDKDTDVSYAKYMEGLPGQLHTFQTRPVR